MKKLLALMIVGMALTSACATAEMAATNGSDDTAVVEKDFSKYDFSKPGFVTKIVDNRLWVFKAEDPELKKFEKDGELGKHVTVPGGGPYGITVKAPDKETIDAYMADK
jgi:hypothetical protein